MGHIHIGYDNPSQEISEKIIYAMDVILGLESIILDSDTKRRELYGNAGCFRFKEYGVEYRTLSNFWIKDNKTIKWAFNKTLEAINLVNSGLIDTIINEYSKEIKEAIDSHNKIKAKLLINKINVFKKQKEKEQILN